MSTTTIRYIGTQDNWPEIAATGKQSVWRSGQTETRPDAEASALLGTGLFEPAGVSVARLVDTVAGFDLIDPDGAVLALTEAVEHGTSLTATGTGYTGAGYFAGINVTAYSGGPQTIVVRESTDNSGPILATFTVSAIGVYPFSPVGNLRVRFATGLHLTISGGTSRTVRALVEPA
jgi:hypothetical protein